MKKPPDGTPIEKSHTPFMTAAETAEAGEPFTIEVSVGKVLDPTK
jgi:hypothetical protein